MRRYSTGSGSDRAPCGEGVSIGARSLPLPVLYQCCLARFSPCHYPDFNARRRWRFTVRIYSSSRSDG